MSGNHRSGRRPKPSREPSSGNRGRRLPAFDQLTEVPRPPTWLGKHGKAEWRRVLPQLVREKVATYADLPGLEGYCAAYDAAVACEAQIRVEGRTIDDPVKKRKITHPLVPVARVAWREVRAFAAEFGLTPATRPRLAAKLPADDEPSDLEAFVALRNEPADGAASVGAA